MKKILVLGHHGQLGCCLYQQLQQQKNMQTNTRAQNIDILIGSGDVVGATSAAYKQYISEAAATHIFNGDEYILGLARQDIDFNQFEQLSARILAYAPDCIINASAYTAVDAAETDPMVWRMNAELPAHLAQLAQKLGAVLLHYSTDYVFDGKANTPYDETSATAPINVYGASKYAGEQAIAQHMDAFYILRTSWVYDTSHQNFFTAMQRLAQTRSTLNVVNDQWGAPNSTSMLSDATMHLLGHADFKRHYGIYHLSNHGAVNWCDYAREIFKHLNLNVEVQGISSDQYPSKAKRAAYSVLNNQKFAHTFDYDFTTWQSDLQNQIAQMHACA